MNFSVIIIGAGAAGLLAAKELSAAGFSVLLLEAAETPGGRINTLRDRGFSGPVEAGAEFVHGSLPITLRLLKEGGISIRPVKGKMMQVRKGQWGQQNMFSGQWEELMQKMEDLEKDLPVADFLAREFPGEKYAGLRDSVQRFAEGYDLADIHTASTRALYEEWQEEGQEEYRIDGGYGRLIDFLASQCVAAGCLIRTASPVKEVRWRPGEVAVTTAGGQTFTGDKLIVTVSLGVLQTDPPLSPAPQSVTSASSILAASSAFGSSQSSDSGAPRSPASGPEHSGALEFFPPIPEYQQAARQLGYGSVTKILMEFREAFWGEKAKGVSFILSDEEIPTWWIQSPDKSRLLTGWLTGAALRKFQPLDDEARLTLCLQSLASIFGRKPEFLKEQLMAVVIADWPATPFIKGGYSFETVNSREAQKLLGTPFHQTLFFAGEALYEGPSPGTVEAAFTSGEEVARKIIAQS